MVKIELTVPHTAQLDAVERRAHEIGLEIQRGSLKSYAGSTHWHFTKPGEKGTLECTWWPAKNRLWLAIHSNRGAGWHDEAIKCFVGSFGIAPAVPDIEVP